MRTLATTTTYEVEKFARGLDGRWFGSGARRFRDFATARAYLEMFAEEQSAVLSNGIRIDLRERRGRRVLATVGGIMDDARVRTIRWMADPTPTDSRS